MAIPDEALELNIDPDHLTYDDLMIFYDDPENLFSQVLYTRLFLMKYSTNWTKRQIAQLDLSDHQEVLQQLLKGLEELASPKANGRLSETGPLELMEVTHHSGSSSETLD